jgi:predicted RNA-binding protein with PIN domain
VHWLVDGMNVVGSRPSGWWRDRRGAMRELVEELERFAAGGGDRVTVVFDGKPFDLTGEEVDVRFASRRGPNAADDDIAGLAEREPDQSEVTVVTSDADLSRRVTAAGADVVGAGAFRRRLEKG